MPYVEGFGTWPFGEEWLFEAVATVYLPLLDAIRGAPVTVGLTPVLCDQLETLPGETGDRLEAFLGDVRAPIHAEDSRGLDESGEPELAAELRRAADDYDRAARTLAGTGGRDLIGAFRDLARPGEGPALWTSSASHAVLPLLATTAGMRLQVEAGIASHRRRFGRYGGGFWLPECAYEPGLERDLAAEGVTAFCVDQTDAFGLGAPEQLEPVVTGAGPTAVPLDWETVSLVWDDKHGYPTDPAYRDYHGRTLHDLRPWNNAGKPYRHEDALARAREHARDFVERVGARLDTYASERGRAGLVTCALDSELLGHWWYEGLDWLRFVLEEAQAAGLDLVTLARRTRALRARRTRARALELGHAEGPLDLGGAGGRRARLRRTPRRAADRRGGRLRHGARPRQPGAGARRARAARAAVERLGVPDDACVGGRLSARAPRGPRRRARQRARGSERLLDP